MLSIKTFLLILCLLVCQLNPFSILMIEKGDTVETGVEVPGTEVDTIVDDSNAVVNEVTYNINGFLTTELDGYCTIDIPQSHWQLATSSELNSDTQKYFKYKDNKSRLLMGYVTNIKNETDVPGYIVQEAAKVDMVTNSKQEVTFGNETWMMVPSTEPIDNMNVVVYYKVSKDGASAFWMKITKDLELDEEEFNEVLSRIVNTYNLYYIGGTLFDTPTTGIYQDTSNGNNSNPDDYKENNKDNTVFQGRGGFITDADISDDWRDMEFILDGTKFTLPCSIQDFYDAGFVLNEKKLTLDTKVYATKTEKANLINDIGTVVTVSLINDTKDTAKPVSECTIVEVKIDSTKFLSLEDGNNTGTETETSTAEETTENTETSAEEPSEESTETSSVEPSEESTESSEETTEEPEETTEASEESEEESSEETTESSDESNESSEENSETSSKSGSKKSLFNGTHELILACGATWDVYTDDLVYEFGNCKKKEKNSRTLIITFEEDNKKMTITIGKIKGIEAVTLSVVNEQ